MLSQTKVKNTEFPLIETGSQNVTRPPIHNQGLDPLKPKIAGLHLMASLTSNVYIWAALGLFNNWLFLKVQLFFTAITEVALLNVYCE